MPETAARKAKIYIIIYTLYGHIYTLAKAIQEGCEASGVAEVSLFRVAETLPAEVLVKMHAPPPPDIPILQADQLKEADAYLFGVPTRFGMVPAQMKAFMDACGRLWQAGALAGRPAGMFFCSALPSGGQETTAFTMLPFLTHMSLIYVPLGVDAPCLFDVNTVTGGSSFGAGTIAGVDGSRQVSAAELDLGAKQGKNFATIAARLIQT